MDASFDAFETSARGGWGAETSYGDLNAGQNVNTATPLPVTIMDLLEVGRKGEENFAIGKYAFNTVSLVGKVVSVRFEQNGAYMTYGLVDPKDRGETEVLSVVQYVNEGAQETDLHVGSMARAIGKIRLYDSRLTVTSFHVQRLDDPKQMELADREAKLAKIYYGKDIPSKTTTEMGCYQNTIFSPNEPQPRNNSRVGATGGAQQPVVNPLQRQPQNGRSPMVSATQQNMGRMSINATSQQRQQPQHIEPGRGAVGDNAHNGSRELSEQQGRILDYIRENDHGEGGISTEQIRQALNLRGDLRGEMQCLLDSALIFTTTGEDHFSAI